MACTLGLLQAAAKGTVFDLGSAVHYFTTTGQGTLDRPSAEGLE